MNKVFCFIVALYLFHYNYCNAQQSLPCIFEAIRINADINFSGDLSDSVWKSAGHISNFTQRELNFGQPASQRTEASIIYDDRYLYIGVWCYQDSVNKITAKHLKPDFDYFSDDNFQVMISPFNDRRNGYLFVINPNGARADAQISGDFENPDWNGVWDVKTYRTTSGWFAEIQIPFSTLQFRNDTAQAWAINFERNICCTKEQVRWQGWSRDYGIDNIAVAGTLKGLNHIGYTRHFELKPYGLAGFEKSGPDKPVIVGKIGGDLNINLSPTLKLNITANTDFAQVEADRIPVNLTRFNLYYPEKREFFLEASNNFNFPLGQNSEVFYSRQIGFEKLTPVPVLGGVRIFGKEGSSNIGFLSIETGAKDSIPATNNSVLRYRYDIGSQSYLGGIITSHINDKGSNFVYGIDANYATSEFLKDKNLTINGSIVQSMDDYRVKNNTLAWRVYYSYPNDLIDNSLAMGSIQQNFDPALGFLYRQNYTVINGHLNFSPRWFTKYGVQQLTLSPYNFACFFTQSTGELESWNNTVTPFGFILKTGDAFQFNWKHSYDRLDNAFELTKNAIIPPGRYYMNNPQLVFSTSQTRKISIDFLYSPGTFYNGTIQTFEATTELNISRHFNLETDYIYNDIRLPDVNVTSHQLAQYINYAFNTRLDFSLFAQWNSLDDLMMYNFRLHWIPKIGTDLYVVYNRGYEGLNKLELLKPQTSTGVAKLVWRFVF
jgi:hypothetical protein